MRIPNGLAKEIDSLQTFLEVDMYSKFRPENKLPTGKNGKMEKWYRHDWFKSEKEFLEYLRAHFDILRKEIRKL